MDDTDVRKIVGEELEKKESSTTMSKDDEVRVAEAIRDSMSDQAVWAEERSCAVSDEFIRLEVQIATIVFAFSSLALTFFQSGNVQTTVIGGGLTLMKLSFAASMFLLMTSLVFGLLHVKKHEQFWDRTLHKRILRYDKWNEVPQKKTTFKEAYEFQEGTRLGIGPVVSVSNWTWVIQSICLTIAVIVLFVLGVIMLFTQSS